MLAHRIYEYNFFSGIIYEYFLFNLIIKIEISFFYFKKRKTVKIDNQYEFTSFLCEKDKTLSSLLYLYKFTLFYIIK
jgi:hypothetical protein